VFVCIDCKSNLAAAMASCSIVLLWVACLTFLAQGVRQEENEDDVHEMMQLDEAQLDTTVSEILSEIDLKDNSSAVVADQQEKQIMSQNLTNPISDALCKDIDAWKGVGMGNGMPTLIFLCQKASEKYDITVMFGCGPGGGPGCQNGLLEIWFGYRGQPAIAPGLSSSQVNALKIKTGVPHFWSFPTILDEFNPKQLGDEGWQMTIPMRFSPKLDKDSFQHAINEERRVAQGLNVEPVKVTIRFAPNGDQINVPYADLEYKTAQGMFGEEAQHLRFSKTKLYGT